MDRVHGCRRSRAPTQTLVYAFLTMQTKMTRKMAGWLANSVFFSRGRRLFEENSKDWNFPLTKFDKGQVGSWLILNDYSRGIFPPKFTDQQLTYQAEKNYRFSLPNLSGKQFLKSNMTKPFWFGRLGRGYISGFNRLTELLEKSGVRPPAKILELGCGSGWMAEFLATMGFDLCGTTLAEDDIADANRRVKSMEAKGLSPPLKFVAVPMESVHRAVAAGSFDAAFVYESLHHAFDWREAVRSTHACLRDGGWLLICNEPNVLHTCIAYRVAKLSNTHEIGFSKRELIGELRKTGFKNIISAGAKLHCWFHPHWLLAQK